MRVSDVIEEQLVRLDAGWVLWLLLSLLAVGAAIALERWVYFRSKTGNVRVIAAELDANLASGNIKAALRVLRPMQSVAAIVARTGLRLAPRGAQAAEKGMRGATAVERKALEARLAYLGGLRLGAPLVGVFGTAIACIVAFANLGHEAALAGSSQAVFATASAALAKSLVCTATGVGIGVFAVAAHAYLQRRVAEFLEDADAVTNLVLTYLATKKPSLPPTGLLESPGQRTESAKPAKHRAVRPSPEAA